MRRSQARTARLLRLWLVLLACAVALEVPAMAQDVSSAKAFVHVTVNTVVQGDYLALLSADDDLALRSQDLEAMGIDLSARPQAPGGDASEPWVWLSSLGAVLTYELEEATMDLRVHASPAVLSRTSIEARSDRATAADVDARSAFANYDLTAQCLDSGWACTLWGRAEAGMNLMELHFFTDASYVTERRHPTRGLSYVIKDFPGRRLRFQAGDVVTRSSPLAGGSLVGGIGLFTEHSVAPYFSRFSLPAMTGMVDTPARVDVYVNNNLVRSVDVPAGRFEVTDLVPQVGNGEVKIRVRDAYNREQLITSRYVQPSSMLGRGVSEGGAFLGFRRSALGRRGFEYGSLAFVGDYRVGVLDFLTLGASTEATVGVLQSGLEATAALSGTTAVSTHAALSLADAGFGLAASAGSSTFLGIWAFGLDGSYFTPEYATVEGRNTFGAPQLSGGVHGDVQVRGWGSLRLGAGSTHYHDGRTEVSGFSELRAGLAGLDASLRVTLRQPIIEDRQQPLDGEAMLTLSLPLGDRVSSSSATRADLEEAIESRLGVQASQRGELGVAGSADVVLSRRGGSSNTDVGYDARGVYNTTVARATLSAMKVPSGGSAYSASLAGGVALLGDSAVASAPVRDAFAMVKVGEVPGVRVYYSNREVGRTNSDGELLVPHLLSYQVNELRVDHRDVPLDWRMQSFGAQAVPGYRAGQVVDFGATRLHAVKGRFLAERDDDDSVPLALGRMTIVTTGASTFKGPTGSNGEFYVESLVPGDYEAMVQVAGARYRCPLELGARAGAVVIDLGEVRCAPL